MQTHNFGCTCIGWHLKETVLWGTIMWSEMGKQNIDAKKGLLHTVFFLIKNQCVWSVYSSDNNRLQVTCSTVEWLQY